MPTKPPARLEARVSPELTKILEAYFVIRRLTQQQGLRGGLMAIGKSSPRSRSRKTSRPLSRTLPDALSYSTLRWRLDGLRAVYSAASDLMRTHSRR
jgi:hypothetical protein